MLAVWPYLVGYSVPLLFLLPFLVPRKPRTVRMDERTVRSNFGRRPGWNIRVDRLWCDWKWEDAR